MLELKKVLALLLCLALCICLFHVRAMAEGAGTIAPVGDGAEDGTIWPADADSIDEEPAEDMPVGTEIPYYAWKQSDPQWSDRSIGTRTLGEVGCAVTSVAMLVVHAGLRDESDFDPGVFLEEMKAVGGFRGNEIFWGKAGEAVDGFHYAGSLDLCGTERDKTAQILTCCQLGFYVVVAVKFYGHYVAVRSAAADSITMMDPGSSSTDLFSKYSADGVVRIHLYSLEDDPALPEAFRVSDPTLAVESAFAFRIAAGGLRSELLIYYPN
ncbi:MAG: hypothetical protein IK095_02900 [Oscillospiraceae bacterium]|nr:hypothetical protein [Oscillospiraceae bacterium]